MQNDFQNSINKFGRLVSLGALVVLITGCSIKQKDETPAPSYQIGTGSKIDVLKLTDIFKKGSIPKGWVIEGLSHRDVLAPKKDLPYVYMTQRDRENGVFIQTGPSDFILARYTRTRLNVTPYLQWRWHVSEHRSADHPIRLLIGFIGGKAGTPSPRPEQFKWIGKGLPAYDRLLSIGFADSGLRRGTRTATGRIPHFIQSGGIENTNRWRDEATDLQGLYKLSWPQDDSHKAFISFVGFMSPSKIDSAGMTFSYVWLTR